MPYDYGQEDDPRNETPYNGALNAIEAGYDNPPLWNASNALMTAGPPELTINQTNNQLILAGVVLTGLMLLWMVFKD
ncbi:MAG: hypothetical protein FD161_66 [Limisphaerales bacterium]|nr:MAG: hypothetical protein FD161_66 [Limisphaerales bacterium]KAG0510512.1 MAG: hypothetical protein E1N63_66 [Limisphaerales bacterium]TXT52785.1 MAG: hypothetical protein FD140_328 [Limisphaerales bacterium]